jgi:hypothetical protein
LKRRDVVKRDVIKRDVIKRDVVRRDIMTDAKATVVSAMIAMGVRYERA